VEKDLGGGKGQAAPMSVAETQDPMVEEAWAEILQGSDSLTKGWLAVTKPLGLHDSLFILAVPNEFARDRVESRLRNDLESRLARHFDRPVNLAITIDPKLETLIEAPVQSPEPAPAPAVARPADPTLTRLNPKYTFDAFVIGESNRFAHAAAIAVAENPGKSYNPLMIYGESGLGKTHQLHAIGHYIRAYFPEIRVKYVSTEELTNDFINSIQDNRAAEFRRTYRDNVDVLLIDDIQFLEAKIQTQEEFFHTFNALHTAQKQIVLTSDRPPRSLEALEPRLRSRFEWGLMTDIQPPSLETRIAILRKKAISERLTAGPDVLEFIASRIPTNIRELEGALIRITAFATLNRQEVDLPLAEVVLRDLIPPEGGEVQISASLIMGQVTDYYSVSVDDMCGSSRANNVVTARQIAMYLCRELTDLSLPKIGELFGGKDHTTVLYAVRKIAVLLREQRSVFNQVTELTNRIKRAAT
jgi:chromosomal replication initiator protein